MTALDQNPTQPNFFSPVNFRFFLKRAPQLNFFAQSIRIPGISIVATQQPTPFVAIPQSGEHVLYNELGVMFRVDEDLKNYIEMHTWLRGLGKPESFDEYAELASVKASDLGKGVTSDAVVHVLDSQRNLTFEFVFRNAFPVSLSDINFDASAGDIDFVEATVEFRYTLYDINRIKVP